MKYAKANIKGFLQSTPTVRVFNIIDKNKGINVDTLLPLCQWAGICKDSKELSEHLQDLAIAGSIRRLSHFNGFRWRVV